VATGYPLNHELKPQTELALFGVWFSTERRLSW
jgi:hypothetical protein